MNKNIEFYTNTQEAYDSIPHPMPASKFIPKWFKNLRPELKDVSTIKRCVPFLDSLTAGYIIPLWQDIHFETGYEKDNTPFINYSWPVNLISGDTPLSEHSWQQIEGSDISKTPLGQYPIKFNNPWVIKTPPGVSCLFTTPMNHFETRIKLVDGIVDTDTYYNNVNFPFLWNGGDGEFLIEKGTPLAQVIPFVRYDFNKFNVKPLDHDKFGKVNRTLGTTLGYGYRKYFWHKRKK